MAHAPGQSLANFASNIHAEAGQKVVDDQRRVTFTFLKPSCKSTAGTASVQVYCQEQDHVHAGFEQGEGSGVYVYVFHGDVGRMNMVLPCACCSAKH